MIEWLWEKVTGRPYWTGRSMVADFGPPPNARYAAELSKYPDEVLVKYGDRILAALRERDRRAAASDDTGQGQILAQRGVQRADRGLTGARVR